MAGTLLEDKYRLIRVLGSGAMAHVYEAEQMRLGRSVAVKIMRVALASDKRSLERFRTEALAASRINHPNAIAIYDVGVTKDGVPYIVMEHLRGITLAQALADRTFSVERVVSVGSQVLAALDEAHGCGVIHRDLKSENVVLEARRDGSDFVKVLDFGIAAFVGSADASIVGTPEYMAPEQIRGDPPVPATDIYAMGVMLYEMVTGRTPFAGVALSALLERHLAEIPTPPSRITHCPPVLEAIIQRALEKDPRRRFPDAREMRAGLLGVIGTTGRTCPSCGERVVAGVRFCGACGTELETGAPRATLSLGSGSARAARSSSERARVNRLTFDISSSGADLVGRDAETEAVSAFLDAGPGAPSTLAVIGPTGVGKARLVLETLHAQSGQLVSFVAAPDPSGHQLSWYPVMSMIEAVHGLPPRPTYDELTHVLKQVALPPRDAPGLAELFGVDGPLAPLELAVRRRETYAATARALTAAGQRWPRTVLCFIDVDKYDQPSRTLIDTLAQQITGPGVRLVVTQTEEGGVPAGAQVLGLSGLAARDAATFLTRLVGEERLAAIGVARVMELTAGVPAALQQLAGWLILENDPAAVPERLVDLVAERLGALPPAARRILQSIAAHGQVAARAELAEELDEIDPSGSVVAQLVRGGLVTASPDDLTIPLAIVAQVAEACTPAESRRELSRAILERARDPLPLAIVAHHAEIAGDLDRALAATVAAGDDAVRRFDDPRAAALYHRAVTIARRLQASGDTRAAGELVAVSLRLSDVLRFMGELALATGCLDEAELFAPTGAQQAGLLRARGRIALMSGQSEAGVSLLRRAIGAAYRAGDTEFLCETYIDLAGALAGKGSLTAAIAELGEAIDTLTLGEGLDKVDKPVRLWLVGMRLANLHVRAGNLVAAKKVGRAALVHAERTSSAIGQGRLHALLADVLAASNDTHGALVHQGRALEHLRRLGDRRSTAELLMACARVTGDLTPSPPPRRGTDSGRRRETARRAVEAASELAAEIGWDIGPTLPGVPPPRGTGEKG
jgi:serine/threonine-protein kinase